MRGRVDRGQLRRRHLEDYYFTPWDLGYGARRVRPRLHRTRRARTDGGRQHLTRSRSRSTTTTSPRHRDDVPGEWSREVHRMAELGVLDASLRPGHGRRRNHRGVDLDRLQHRRGQDAHPRGPRRRMRRAGHGADARLGEEAGGTTKPTVEEHVQTEIRAVVSPVPYVDGAHVLRTRQLARGTRLAAREQRRSRFSMDIVDPESSSTRRSTRPRRRSCSSELAAETRATLDSAEMLTGRVVGRLLELLVHGAGARRVLEIGTFSGYSALSMAAGLPADGRSTRARSIPRAPRWRAAHRQEPVRRPDHGSRRAGTRVDRARSQGEFDFVFIDADKPNYANYLEAVLPRLAERGLIAIDNTLWSGEVLDPRDDNTSRDRRAERQAGLGYARHGRPAHRARRSHSRTAGLGLRCTASDPPPAGRAVRSESTSA